MHQNTKRSILLIAAITLTLGVSGCSTLFYREAPKQAPDRERPLFQKGQELGIHGRIVMNRNQVLLEDQNSPAVFRLVGLRPEHREELSRHAGELIWVRLKVISVESARLYNARIFEPRSYGKHKR